MDCGKKTSFNSRFWSMSAIKQLLFRQTLQRFVVQGVLMKFLYPDIYVKNIRAIPYGKMLERNIKLLVFDIDNTLVPYDMPEATEDLVIFLNGLKAQGFEICLLSNNNKKRVELFNKKFNFTAIYKARKPASVGIKKIINMFGVSPEEVAIIGDQIFTDIWCGNRNKMFTILTKPVEKRDSFGVYLKRGIERKVVDAFKKKAYPIHKKS